MKTQNFKFQWVSCDGGPLMVIEQKYIGFWQGSDAPSDGRAVEADSRFGLEAATDYDRACDIEDYIDLIDVGGGKAIILGGDELATTWLPISESREGALIRWSYGNSEADVLRAAVSLSNESGKGESLEFTVEDSDLVLFAACESASDSVYPRLKYSLAKGTYKISTIEYEDEQTSIICHRFRRKI